jgi:hypothetical protein
MTKTGFDPPGLTQITAQGVTCGRVNQFIVIGLLSDRYTIQWCAIGDATDWPIPGTDDARAKQAGQQTFASDYGNITGIAGNDFFGYVFQEKGITKMTYVGGDVVFAFDTFEESRGCFELNRYVSVDDLTFFESEYGYHAIENDQISDIGHGIVDDAYPPTATARQQNVCKNEAINCVFFESQNLCFNYKTGQWSRLPANDGYSYINLNSTDGIIGRTVILPTLAGIGSGTGGTVQTATLTTTGKEPNPFGKGTVQSVRPRSNGGTHAYRVGVQDDEDDTVTWVTGSALNARSLASHFRGQANAPTGRFVRVEDTVTGGFTSVIGADIEATGSAKT